MSATYPHLIHIENHSELHLYELIPDIVWIFDVDEHRWWWGNQAALKYWGLDSVNQLVHKDLSGDTQGARDRIWQTFELAQQQGLTTDPWTTYPGGKPKTLLMRHRAVLVGPEKHRAIIAYINEQVSLGEEPEHLLLVEAMRYTRVLVSSFDLSGKRITENPAATQAYTAREQTGEAVSDFVARFADREQGQACWSQAKEQQGGRWTYQMRTACGVRRHTLDIRQTRHPLTGEFLLLVVEYDVTDLQQALDEADQAKTQLHKMAHYDALTNLPNLRLFEERGRTLLNRAQQAAGHVAILFIDLDGFKTVNDRYGHLIGDQLLKAVAQRLSEHSRHSDLVARIGGDEFVILQSQIAHRNNIETLAQKLVELIGRPYSLAGVDAEVILGVSIGIACYPDDGCQMQELLDKADRAMYQVKQTGKSHFKFYSGKPSASVRK